MGFFDTWFVRNDDKGAKRSKHGESIKPLLPIDALMAQAQFHAATYATAEPFPHAVFENFIDAATVSKVSAEFPIRDKEGVWLDYNGSENGKIVQHRKYHISDERLMGPVTQRLLYELKSPPFLQVLSTLTAIQNLIPDVHNHGGGIHMNCNGALLKIHADFNSHPDWHLDRRLNLLLYLNDGWQPVFGGDLELWDETMTACIKKIAPIAGNCVIFSTSSKSYHGHPDPITCPEDVARKSVALYYYTAPPQASNKVVHSTLWQPRPGSTD